MLQDTLSPEKWPIVKEERLLIWFSSISSRHQGKPVLPVGHECLSMEFMRENGTRLLESLE